MIMLKRESSGFSLVEVAIAVVVIGLIVSFSIKGRELIATARLRAVMDQVNTFKIATQSFVDKYGALPGDLANATDVISGATVNGKGNGAIVSLEDAKRFWHHLQAANLISVEMVNGLPVSKCGGCFSVSSNIPGKDGVWIVLCQGTNNNSQFTGILSPEDAYSLDRSHDTGDPFTGDIQTMRASGASGECFVNSKYNIKNKNKICVVLFKVW